MTKDQLLEKLNDTEWTDFEVKEAAGGLPKSMWETVCSFANTSGGWIVLGVRETRANGLSSYEIVGVDNVEKMEQDVVNVLRSVSKFNVPILVSAHRYVFDNKVVLAFYIPSSGNKPVYFGNNLNNTYIRIGSGDRRASDVEIEILMREKTFGIKSEMEVGGTTFEDINRESLRTYRRRIVDYNPDFRYNSLDDLEFCHKVGIMSHDALTYGGLLMLGRADIVKQYIPHFWVDYIEIPGPTYSDAECRYTYRMPEQDNLWEYFKVLIHRLKLYVDNPFMAGPDGFSPEDNSQLYCLREVLVNLLAHADYFSPIHSTIRVFNDRIEFQNPGRFAIDISAKPGVVKSVPRNPNLIAFFRFARLGENAGYGIDKILRWSELTGMGVTFDNDLMSSTLTYSLPAPEGGQMSSVQGSGSQQIDMSEGGQKEVVRKGGQKQGDETRNKIINAMRVRPEISRKELVELIGISSSAIQKHIEYLKKNQTIVRLGNNKNGFWKVLNK